MTWQVSAAQQAVGVLRRDRQVPRPRHAGARTIQRRRPPSWNSPAYHTTADQVDIDGEQPAADRGGWSSNLEYYTNELSRRRRQDARHAGMVRQRVAPRARSRRPQDRGDRPELTQSPERAEPAGGGDLRDRVAQHQSRRAACTWGDVHCTRVRRQRRSHAAVSEHTPTGVPLHRAGLGRSIRNTPLVLFGERLNHDLGHLRCRTRGAEAAHDQRRPALGSAERAGARRASRRPGAWRRRATSRRSRTCRTGRTGRRASRPVYDLFGNGKTAVKYSLNRYNQPRTTGIAADYNPLLSRRPSSLPWARPERRRHRAGLRDGCVQLLFRRRAARSISTRPVVELRRGGAQSLRQLSRARGISSSALELQHELMPRPVGVGRLVQRRLPQPDDDRQRRAGRSRTTRRTRSTTRSPVTPIKVFARSAAAQRRGRHATSIRSIPSASGLYTGVSTWSSRGASRPRRVSSSAASRSSAQLEVNCTSRTIRTTSTTIAGGVANAAFCDDHENGIPYRKRLQARRLASRCRWGINAQRRRSRATTASPRNSGDRHVTAVTRGTTRYPANCPSPCPAGEIIMPTAIFGQPSMNVNLRAAATASSANASISSICKVAQTVQLSAGYRSRRRSRSST